MSLSESHEPDCLALGYSLALMVLVALAARLILAAFRISYLVNPQNDHFSFGWEMGRVGRSLASGRGFASPFQGDTGPTAAQPPLYPLFLGAVFKLFGIYTKASARVVLCIQSLISALTCLPIFFMARRTFGPRVAYRAGWAWAFFPYAIFYSGGRIWATTLSALLLSLLFLLAMSLAEGEGLRTWLVFGLLWGLVALSNPTLLVALPAMGCWICFHVLRRGGSCLQLITMAALVFLACITPWVVRNYRTFGHWIPLRSNLGLELYVGNSTDTEEPLHAGMHPSNNESELHEMKQLGEANYMAEKRRQALVFVRRYPGIYLWLILKRIAFIWIGAWNLSPGYLMAHPGEALNIPFITIISALGFAGLLRAFRQDPSAAWLYALVLTTAPLVYYLTAVEIPYRHPVDPFALVLVVVGVA